MNLLHRSSAVVVCLSLAVTAAAAPIRVELSPAHYTSPRASMRGRAAREDDMLPPDAPIAGSIVFETDASSITLPLVVTPGPTGDRPFNLLWSDADGNGQYDAGEAVSLKGYGKDYARVAGVRRVIMDGGQPVTATFSGSLRSWNDAVHLSLSSATAFEGTTELDGTGVALVLRDTDGNGRISEFMANDPRKAGAALLCAPDRKPSQSLQAPLAPTMGLLGTFYTVEMEVAGTRDAPRVLMTLTPQEIPTLPLGIQGKDIAWIAVAGERTSILAQPTDGAIRVPEGGWTLVGLQVRDGGQLFEGKAQGQNGNRRVVVRPGRDSSLVVGGPLKHSIEVGGRWASGRLSLSLGATRGMGGLTYKPVGQRGDPPGWRIQKPNGEVVASGDFAYG